MSSDDCYLTVGILKKWISDFKLKDSAKVYVQMPDNLNIIDLERANLHDPIEMQFDDTPGNTICYVRAWGPCSKKGEGRLYIEIYY
ncbi:MAG TPA: hypothetical protein VMW50_10340 [Dehalococcoidia bacterium]|nr:hypothetical protein [Dehalococcoidia bacterium]